MLPFLCFGHGSPPSMFGNEPGVQKWEIFQAGSSHTNSVARHQCSGARAWDQTDERARRSKHQWEYDLRLSLPWRSFKIPLGLDWSAPNASSFLLWRWPQLELLMRNSPFLIWFCLSLMRNSSLLIRVGLPQIRRSPSLGGVLACANQEEPLSIENWKRRRDVLNFLSRLFTAKKVIRSATFYKQLSRTVSLAALLRFYTDTFALNKSSA